MKNYYTGLGLTAPKLLAFVTVDQTTLQLYDICPVTNQYSIFVIQTGESYCLYNSACFLDALLYFQNKLEKIIAGIEICNDCE
jgi:hypothetical protein